MKILVFGLPGAGKTTFAKRLIEGTNFAYFNADEVRGMFNDWDFSKEGRMRQADRMKYLSDVVVEAGQIVVADFICPTEETRKEFDADFTVWMDTIKEGRFDDTNQMFEPPSNVDYHITQWFDDTYKKLLPVIERYLNNKTY